MNFKKIVLITLLLLAVLTIGAVSAADDVDALAADDTGDDQVFETPVEDASLEADETDDVFEGNSNVVLEDEVSGADDLMATITDSDKVYGTVAVFLNDTQVAERYFGGLYSTEKMYANKIAGSFEGTYNMKVVYHNGNDKNNYSNEGVVTFTNLIENKLVAAEDFNFTLANAEVDINSEDTPIITFQWPEGTNDRDKVELVIKDSWRRSADKNSGDTSGTITLADLYIFDPGTFEFTAYYRDNDGYMTKLSNGTFRVTKTFTANDFIELYDKTITDPTDYVCNVYDSYGGLNGEVTVLANSTQVYYKKFNGSPQAVRINGENLTGDLKGTYNIKVIYKRASNGKEYSKQSTITFGNSEPATPDTRPWIDFDVKASDIRFGDELLVTFTEENNIPFTGKVGVRIFESSSGPQIASVVVDANNGTGSANFSDLPVGNFRVDVYSNETDSYKAGYGYKDFTVKKAWSTILFYDSIVDLDVNTPFNLTVDFEKATGITAKVDGENVTVNGNEILIPALNMGTHTLEISTIPDDNHIEDTREVTLNVTKPKSSIVLEGKFSFDKGSSTNITVTTKNAIDFNASIENHPEAIIRNGNVITISGLDVGSYTLTVTTIVDDDHLSVTEKATIKVNRLIATIEFGADELVFDEGSSGSIIANVSNGGISKAIIIAHSEAVINIKGNNITVSNLTAGNYTLSVTSKPNTGYSANVKSVKVIVNPAAGVKVNSSVSVSDVVMDYGTTKNVTVETVGAVGFTAKIDGKDAEVHDNYVVVPVLDVGKHTLSVTTIPDAGHLAVSKNATITVNKLATSVSASKISVAYGVSKNIVVTLKDSKGNALANKKVSIKFNNVDYIGTTGSDGKASITITKTSVTPKTYPSTITFAGDGTYAKSTGNVNVVVTKATPKITAKAKSFKKSVKTKKYTITLKANNKVMKSTKVTLKVNKKTYTAKTNSKGQATFKITKLTKKGKYTAVVKYAGNSNYKAVTAKPKITIK